MTKPVHLVATITKMDKRVKVDGILDKDMHHTTYRDGDGNETSGDSENENSDKEGDKVIEHQSNTEVVTAKPFKN